MHGRHERPVAAALLIADRRDLHRAGKLDPRILQGLDSHDGGHETRFHVAGPDAVDLARVDDAAIGIMQPVFGIPGRHAVDMAVEQDALLALSRKRRIEVVAILVIVSRIALMVFFPAGRDDLFGQRIFLDAGSAEFFKDGL